MNKYQKYYMNTLARIAKNVLGDKSFEQDDYKHGSHYVTTTLLEPTLIDKLGKYVLKAIMYAVKRSFDVTIEKTSINIATPKELKLNSDHMFDNVFGITFFASRANKNRLFFFSVSGYYGGITFMMNEEMFVRLLHTIVKDEVANAYLSLKEINLAGFLRNNKVTDLVKKKMRSSI